MALCLYDHLVVSKVLDGRLPDFVSGDKDGIEAYLSAEHVAVVKNLMSGQPSSQGGATATANPGKRKRNKEGGGGNRGGGGNSKQDFTAECLKWNFTTCELDDCNRKHVCIHCKAAHKGKNCKLDRDQLVHNPKQT